MCNRNVTPSTGEKLLRRLSRAKHKLRQRLKRVASIAPNDLHGVARELDHIACVLEDAVDQLLEIRIDVSTRT
jgi:hypothetical protein